jgi:hypothetical protein
MMLKTLESAYVFLYLNQCSGIGIANLATYFDVFRLLYLAKGAKAP